MLFLLQIPVLLLIIPSNRIFQILCLAMLILAGCLAYRYKVKLEKSTIDRTELCEATTISVALGCFFYCRCLDNKAIEAFVMSHNLPMGLSVVLASVILAAASVLGIYVIIQVVKNIIDKIYKKEVEIDDRKFKRYYWIILLGCTALYFALLGCKNIWSDEGYTLCLIRRTYPEIWRITAADVHPPLYYYALKLLTKPFGYSLLSTKLFSVIPYIFILAFGGIQFKKLFGNKAALLFMVLFFALPYSMSYVIEIRMYSIAAAFVFANAVYAYRCYIEDKISNWVYFVIFGVCSAYTHYFALVSTGIVYAILFLAICIKRRDKLLKWIIASVCTVILYLPWLGSLISQLKYKVENEYWIGPITVKTVINYFNDFFSFGEKKLSPVASVVFSAYIAATVRVCKSKRKTLALLALSVPLGTIAVGVIASIIVRPVFVLRYIAPATPVLIAFLVLALKENYDNKALCGFAVAISLAVGLLGYAVTFRGEYRNINNSLNEDLLAKYSDVDCYVDISNAALCANVIPVYTPEKTVYALNNDFSICPTTSVKPLDELDTEKNDKILLIIDDTREPEEDMPSGYNSEFVSDMHCGVFDYHLYLLTK